MKRILRPSFAALFLVLLLTYTGNAWGRPFAPEIDPGTGVSALAVLGTAIAILRGSRKA